MKKWSFLLLMSMLLLIATFPVSAQRDALSSMPGRQLPRVVDAAGLLDDAEEENLRSMLDGISERHQCDVAVVTVYSLNGKTAEAYADDFYDENGYGQGSGDDGIMLLISMEYRDWAITTHGYGITAFTDAGQEYIVECLKPYLSDGDYADAFTSFAEVCEQYLTQAGTGKPYDMGNLPRASFNFMLYIPLALIIGLMLAFIILSVLKRKLKSVRRQAAASDYIRKDSLRITESNDIFLYSKLNKRPRPKNNNSSGGSGSRTHTSSSGRSHGGSSGKF